MVYDERHRGKIQEERTQVLKPLRPRLHKPLRWDDRYAPYLKRCWIPPVGVASQGGPPRYGQCSFNSSGGPVEA